MTWTDFSRVNYEEKMLWACVLRRAVFDYVLYKGVGKHKLKFQRAHQFLFGEEEEDYTGLSFDQICGLFGWEPGYLRRKIKKLERHDIKKLEASAFKECFDEGTATILTESAKWETGQACPMFVPFNYNSDYRARMALRDITPQEPKKRPKSIIPVSTWAAAVA